MEGNHYTCDQAPQEERKELLFREEVGGKEENREKKENSAPVFHSVGSTF